MHELPADSELVHICANVNEVESLLNCRSLTRPAPVLILVPVDEQVIHSKSVLNEARTEAGCSNAAQSLLRSDCRNANELHGFDLLEYINRMVARRKLERVLTAACLRYITPETVTKAFDVGSDEFLHFRPEAIEIDRLAWVCSVLCSVLLLLNVTDIISTVQSLAR